MADREPSLKGGEEDYYNQSDEDTEDFPINVSNESESESDSELFEESDSEVDEEFLQSTLGAFFDTSSVGNPFKSKKQKELESTHKQLETIANKRIQKLKDLKNWSVEGMINKAVDPNEIIKEVDPKKDPRGFRTAIDSLITAEKAKISNSEKEMKQNILNLVTQKTADKEQKKLDAQAKKEKKKLDTQTKKEQKKLLQQQQQQQPKKSSFFSRKQKSVPISSTIPIDPNAPPTPERPREAYWDKTQKKLLYRNSSSSSYPYMNASQPILTFPYATTFHNSRSQQYYVPSSSYNNLQQIMTANDEDEGISF